LLNDVPPRLVKKLETDFEKALVEIDEYLKKGKVVSPKNPETLDQPSLTKTAGGSTPDKQKAEEDLSKKWNKITF
jgi:hypothetical protein